MSNKNNCTLLACGNYKLNLQFSNGSFAKIDFQNRINNFRFHKIASLSVFYTAKVKGEKVVWTCPDGEFSVYITELLESMLT